MTGYVKEYRSIMRWEWYTDYKTAHLFRHCILRANIEKKKWHGIEIERGSFATSLANLSRETGLTIKEVRTALNKLKRTNELASDGHSQYTIITVKNWELYQAEGKQSDKQRASEGQAKGKRRATTKEVEEVKEVKEVVSFTKKTDPTMSEAKRKFVEEYQKVFKARPFLSWQDQLRITELSAQYEDFVELIPSAISRLKNIDFKDIDFKPTATWLLKGNNFERVMNGEFDKKETSTQDVLKAWANEYKEVEEL